jgi:hypothetical protein
MERKGLDTPVPPVSNTLQPAKFTKKRLNNGK